MSDLRRIEISKRCTLTTHYDPPMHKVGLSIDEVALSEGKLYKIVSKKAKNGSTSLTATDEPGLSQVVWFNAAGTQVVTGLSLTIESNLAGLEDGEEWFYLTSKDANGFDVKLYCLVVIITEDCCLTPNCAGVTVIKN